MRYLVYIIYSAPVDRFYVGYTAGEIGVRLRKHNAHHNGFTGKNDDWVIKHIEEYESKAGAMKRETESKGWKSRLKIEQLFAN